MINGEVNHKRTDNERKKDGQSFQSYDLTTRTIACLQIVSSNLLELYWFLSHRNVWLNYS